MAWHHDACTVPPHSSCLVLADSGHHSRIVLHRLPISQCYPSCSGEHALPFGLHSACQAEIWLLGSQSAVVQEMPYRMHPSVTPGLQVWYGRWLMSQMTLLLLAGDSSHLARRVDSKMDVCFDEVLHCADIKVQSVPGALLNWPALGLASTLAAACPH